MNSLLNETDLNLKNKRNAFQTNIFNMKETLIAAGLSAPLCASGSAELYSLPSGCHIGIIGNNGAIIAKVNY